MYDKDNEARLFIVKTLENKETSPIGDISLSNSVRIIIPNNFASVILSIEAGSVRLDNVDQTPS